jgi:protein SCO1/2
MSFGQRIQDRVARLVGAPWFWLIFVAVLFAYPLSFIFRSEIPKPPPVMFALPEFALTDHLGKPFGSKELAGRVWVANFIFTSCPTMCPELTETMKRVQKRMRNMGDAVYLVSISVDPERDTPEKLFEFAKKYQVNPRRWRFLTGDLTAVKDAVEKGFKMPMDKQDPPEGETIFDITHGSRFVLVDQHNRVRGLYETDDANIDEMVHHLAVLANLGDGDPGPTASAGQDSEHSQQ